MGSHLVKLDLLPAVLETVSPPTGHQKDDDYSDLDNLADLLARLGHRCRGGCPKSNTLSPDLSASSREATYPAPWPWFCYTSLSDPDLLPRPVGGCGPSTIAFATIRFVSSTEMTAVGEP